MTIPNKYSLVLFFKGESYFELYEELRQKC